MSVEVGQKLSLVVGKLGSYAGDSNAAMGKTILKDLGAGFSAEQPITTAGFFNNAAAGGGKSVAEPTALAPSVPSAQFTI